MKQTELWVAVPVSKENFRKQLRPSTVASVAGLTGPQHQRLVRGVAPKHRGVLVGTVCAVQSATASFALKLASGAVNVPLRPGGEVGDVHPDHHGLAMHKRCVRQE